MLFGGGVSMRQLRDRTVRSLILNYPCHLLETIEFDSEERMPSTNHAVILSYPRIGDGYLVQR